MAIGNAFVTKGHVPKLQSSAELHKPSVEPEPTRAEKERPHKKVEHEIAVLFARELEENLGLDIVDTDHDWTVHMEVL